MIHLGGLTSVIKVVFAPLQWLWNLITQPKIAYPKAPSNILQHTFPSSSRKLIEQRFGSPWHEHSKPDNTSTAAYVFSNALMQLEYENSAVTSVLLISLLDGPYRKWPLNLIQYFEIPHLDLKIGKSTFGDVFGNTPLEMKKDYSSKFFILWQKQYYGNPGRYCSYQFGALSADTRPVASIEMPEINEPGPTSNSELVHHPTKYKFNAIRITSKDFNALDYFGYSHGVFP